MFTWAMIVMMTSYGGSITTVPMENEAVCEFSKAKLLEETNRTMIEVHCVQVAEEDA